MSDNVGMSGSGLDKLFRQLIPISIFLIAHDETLVAIEHAYAFTHVFQNLFELLILSS